MNYSKYRFGIELEVLVPDKHKQLLAVQAASNKIPFHFGGDGSIKTGGIVDDLSGVELRFAKPLTYLQTQKAITKIIPLLNKLDVSVNKSCGYHLHISNSQFFNTRYIKRLIFFWAAIEDVLIATQPVGRGGNQYCRRFLQRFTKDKWALPRGKEKLLDRLACLDRYTTINLSALDKHGTIEVRLHAGTTNKAKILNWVDLMLSIYEYTRERFNYTQVKTLFDTPISLQKVRDVFTLLIPDLLPYYERRIVKQLFFRLQKQQETAKKNYHKKELLLKAQQITKKELRRVLSA